MLQFKRQSLRSLAIVLGSQFGVDITIQGDTAYTDYSVNPPIINIPDINLLDPNADNELTTTLVRGFLDHESGHVRFSDRDVATSFNNAPNRTASDLFDDRFLRNLWNIYEDVFIERKMGQYYKGCAVNLRNIGNYIFVGKAPDSLVQQAYEPFKSDREYSMASALTYALMQITLYSARGQANPDMMDVLDRWMTEIQGIHQKKPGQPVPEALCKFHKKLQPIAQQAVKTNTSQECLDLALQTVALMEEVTKDILKDYQQKQKQSQQRLDSMQKQAQQGGGGQQSGGASQEELDKEKKFNRSCQSATNTLDNLAKSLAARAASATGDKQDPCDIDKLRSGLSQLNQGSDTDELSRQAMRSQQSMDSPDLVDKMARDMHDLVKQQQQNHTLSRTKTYDCTRRGFKDMNVDGDPAMSVDKIKDAAINIGNTLGRRVRSLLQTNTLVRRSTSAQGTRIDTRKLWRMSASNPRVFCHETEGRAVDTEIIMVVDCSGSMDGNCHISAMGSALGMLIATQTIPACNIGIVAHTSETIYIMKHPRQYMRPQDVKLVPASGGTFIGGAYRTAMEEFTGQARRNIIILLSDGQSSSPLDIEVLKEGLEEAGEAGIDTLGVGLGDRHLARVLPEDKFSYARNYTEVPAILFGLLRKAMA